MYAKVDIVGSMSGEFKDILTVEAMDFLAMLAEAFETRRQSLMQKRAERQQSIDAGARPDFLPETAHIREGDWTIDPPPADLRDRRVEITGPVDRKMIINALNSGANVFMADFEDANAPTWENNVQGQINLRDAVAGTIHYVSPEGKEYALREDTATLVVRPRGWHLIEKHFLVDGKPISASLFDFGLYMYHNAHKLVEKGSGPYFYLPKLENHLEARLWNDVFVLAQQELGLPRGTIKATVLIETILAAFEMEEILYELREHSVGLNCGRWDYIFSYLKKFRNHDDVILPDRALVTMTVPFMRAYSLLAIQTCHRRRTHAIGGMAAHIPVRHDPKANEVALQKVREDKEREARDGHDGTWVAHPALVPVAKQAFDEHMPGPNQFDKMPDVKITAEQLLEVPEGPITEEGLRTNISVGVQYVAAWLQGRGAVPINNLMEDAATAEISRGQIWQWLRHEKGVLSDGRKVTRALFERMLKEELDKIQETVGEERYDSGRFDEASALFSELVLEDDFVDYLTIPGYERLLDLTQSIVAPS